MKPLCSVCNEVADISLSIRHKICGHSTHSDCIGEKPNFKNCAKCSGEVWPVISSSASMIMEPKTTDGIDYVLTPGTRAGSYKLKTVASYIPVLGAKVADRVETSKDPAFLLDNKQPLPLIMKRNGLGLDHMLRAGITVNDFLKNGYTFKDLLIYEDISKKGSKRALQALTIGLKANANHLRDYSDSFPWEAIKAHTKCDTSALCENFGLTFPPDGPLNCCGDDGWNAKHCVALGLTIDDLCDYGLSLKQQYEDLMTGLSTRESSMLEKKLQVTLKHIEGLVDIEAIQRAEEEEAEAQRRATASQTRIQRTAPVQIQSHQVVYEDEEPQEEEYQDTPYEEPEEPEPTRMRVASSMPKAKDPRDPPHGGKINHVPPSSRRKYAPPQSNYTEKAKVKYLRHGKLQ